MSLRKKSAQKRAKTSKKRRTRNLKAKGAIKKAFKAIEKAITQKTTDFKDLINKAVSAIDKAAEGGIIHRNKANRKKSRLMLKLNKLKI